MEFHLLNHLSMIYGIFKNLHFEFHRLYSCRWQPPVPVSKWSPKVINATTAPPACPQPPCHVPDSLCPKIVCYILKIYR